MAEHFRTITVDGFNDKYKNMLKDFYIYQFKENRDIKGGNKKGEIKVLTPTTIQKASQRLQSLFAGMIGVEWKGDGLSKKTLVVTPKKNEINPFFSLYKTCGKKSYIHGGNFAVLFAVAAILNNDGKFLVKGMYDSDFFSVEADRLRELVGETMCKMYFAETGDDVEYEKVPLEKKREYLEKIHNRHEGLLKGKHAVMVEDSDGLGRRYLDVKYKERSELYKKVLCNNRQIALDKDGRLRAVEYRKRYTADKLYEFVIASMKEGTTVPGREQFGKMLNEMVQLGILGYTDGKYFLSDCSLSLDMSGDFLCRFKEMVRFFAETDPMGSVGYLLLNRMEKEKGIITFKHDYYTRALNDYNIADLLFAIENNLWVKMRCVSGRGENKTLKTVVGKAMELRENACDGRQYAVYYDPSEHALTAVRVDAIESVELGTTIKKDYEEEELKNCKERLEYTWSASFPPMDNGNARYKIDTENKKECGLHILEAEIHYDEKTEGYIKERVYKELDERNRYVVKIDSKKKGVVKIELCITDPHEAIKWLRSFSMRVHSIRVDGKEHEVYFKDIKDLHEAYEKKRYNSLFERTTEENRRVAKCTEKVEFIATKKSGMPHESVFNEFFSNRMESLGSILFDRLLFKGKLKEEEIKRIVEEELGGVKADNEEKELFEAQVRYFNGAFSEKQLYLRSRKKVCRNVFDLFPLTRAERCWLSSLLDNDRVLLFVSEEERAYLKAHYGVKEKLFDQNKLRCINRFTGARDVYETKKTQTMFRRILKAIRKNEKLLIEYSKGGYKGEYCPLFVEYSKRDDVFRVFCERDGEVRRLNLERIKTCTKTSERFDLAEAWKTFEEQSVKNEKTLTVLFKDKKNLPERILSEFAAMKKECVREGGLYTMKLSYDELDASEIAVRLLSYGRNVFVASDDGAVLKQMKERLEKQIEIIRETERI